MKPFHLITFCLNSVLQPVGTGLDVFQSRPKLAAWRDRVKQVVGENLFAETHDLVMKASTLSQTLEPEKAQMFRPIMMRYFHWVALQQDARAARLSEKLQVLPPNCAKIHKDKDYTSPGQTTGSKTKMFVSGNHQKARLTCFVTILSCWCSIISTQNIKMKTNREKKKMVSVIELFVNFKRFLTFQSCSLQKHLQLLCLQGVASATLHQWCLTMILSVGFPELRKVTSVTSFAWPAFRLLAPPSRVWFSSSPHKLKWKTLQMQ